MTNHGSSIAIVIGLCCLATTRSVPAADIMPMGEEISGPDIPDGSHTSKFPYMVWDDEKAFFTAETTSQQPYTGGNTQWIVQAGVEQPGYHDANQAWNQDQGYTFFTNGPDVTPPKLGASILEDPAGDGDFTIILAASVGGVAAVLAIIGLIAWRLLKAKNMRNRIASDASRVPGQPIFVMAGPQGMPPVESTLGGGHMAPFSKWQGQGHLKANMAAMMPAVPDKPQINPYFK